MGAKKEAPHPILVVAKAKTRKSAFFHYLPLSFSFILSPFGMGSRKKKCLMGLYEEKEIFFRNEKKDFFKN